MAIFARRSSISPACCALVKIASSRGMSARSAVGTNLSLQTLNVGKSCALKVIGFISRSKGGVKRMGFIVVAPVQYSNPSIVKKIKWWFYENLSL